MISLVPTLAVAAAEAAVPPTSIWPNLGVVFLVCSLGMAGGFGNLFHSGEFHLPKFDVEASVWRPGWIGVVFVGALAALVVYLLTGDSNGVSLQDVMSGKANLDVKLGQLANSVIVGWGGGRILSAYVEAQVLRAEKSAEREARNELTAALSDAIHRG